MYFSGNTLLLSSLVNVYGVTSSKILKQLHTETMCPLVNRLKKLLLVHIGLSIPHYLPPSQQHSYIPFCCLTILIKPCITRKTGVTFLPVLCGSLILHTKDPRISCHLLMPSPTSLHILPMLLNPNHYIANMAILSCWPASLRCLWNSSSCSFNHELTQKASSPISLLIWHSASFRDNFSSSKTSDDIHVSSHLLL